MKNIQKKILKLISKDLKFKDKILLYIFKKYTYNIYKKGTKDSFNFFNVDNVNDLSTLKKLK